MSDAFADLWNSSAPSKPVAPKTLGSSSGRADTAGSSAGAARKTPDVFSLLSSSSLSTSTASINGPQKPTSYQPRTSAVSQPKPSTTIRPIKGTDAFGDLLGNSIATGSTSRMTIAERAAQAERQRLAALQKQQLVANSDASAWAGLDSLVGPSFTPPPSIVPSKPQASISTPSKSQTLWELDDFLAADSASSSQPAAVGGQIKLDDQIDSFLGGNSHDDEDDILGDLSKPVGSISSQDTFTTSARTPSPIHQNIEETKPSGPSRPVSPPPHILGQIVEMGFSVQQARIALAATDTGLDVQAALETLLSNGAASSSLPPTSRHHSPVPAVSRGRPDRIREDSRSSSLQREGNLQEQADKLIAQASEIGLSVLSKASIFWREGKEKVQKAYEERTTGANLPGSVKKPAANHHLSGRPKWMSDNPGEGIHDEDGWETAQGTFEDAGDDRPAQQKLGTTTQPSMGAAPKLRADSPLLPPAHTSAAEADLFTSEPTFYVSPWRRGKPKPKADIIDVFPKAATPRPPSPMKPTPRANVISASHSAVSTSIRHKDRGAEKFKLGQYSEAEGAYSSAIAALPDSHLLLIPLHNNRALTRLKIGDYAGAIEDATAVIGIIGSGFHPARELRVSREEEGSSVDLADGWVKALKRRAEALEGREKWDDAKKDWEALAGMDWARPNTRSEAVRGAGRCRNMIQASSSSSTQPINGPGRSRPKAPPRPAKPPAPTRPSEALARLRSANDAAEAEDQARHDLKDSTDAKILSWKAGKESNIRALLASLDAVLWPELGLQKVGMAELVSPAQVKIRYTKTIAKLHPDKLNPSNSTIEQRMLANGVFGALNDAWNAFK